MTPKQFQILLRNLDTDVRRFLRRDAPMYAANEAIKQFKQNFESESFFGDKWQEVKRRQDPKNFKTVKSGKNKGEVRATNKQGKNKILHGTGNLQRSIKKKIEPGSATVPSYSIYLCALWGYLSLKKRCLRVKKVHYPTF